MRRIPSDWFARSLFATLVIVASSFASAQERAITVASTTSTEQSGLFSYLLPLFSARTGIRVNVVAVGTG
jgi:tungstate transport system substrate-binding protein